MKNKSVCKNKFEYRVGQEERFCFSGKHAYRRRTRRNTLMSTDSLLAHSSHPGYISNKGTTSSSPIPITHSPSQYAQHSSSQPAATGYRRIYSPLTIDTSNLSQIEPSPRRYSASAAVSPPNHHHHNLQVPPIFNLIPTISSTNFHPR